MRSIAVSNSRAAAIRLGQYSAGPIITLVTACVLELLKQNDVAVPNPGVPLTLTIVLSFFVSGSVPGFVSAVLAWLYYAYYFSLPGRPFQFTEDNLDRAIISGLAVAPLVVMLWLLKHRADQSAEHLANAARCEAQIAELKWGEEKLRQAEAAGWETARFLRTIIAAEPECVKLVAPDGKLLDMNPAGLAMLECASLAEAQSVPLSEFVAVEHRAAFGELHHRVMRGESGMLEFEIVSRRGTRRCVDTHAVPLHDQGGQITALLAITRDITARKQADETTRKSEEFFRLIWENSADGMRLTNEEGTMVRVNQAFCRMMGQTREAIEGKSLAVNYAVDRQDHIVRMHRERFKSRTIKPYLETEITLRTGENKWVAVANSFLELEGSPPMLLGIFRDITERKQAENQLLDYAARLRMLSGQTLAVQENERRHIARELHDEIGQVLTAVTINLHAVRASAGSSAWPTIDESLDVVNQAIEQVRNMSLDLRPSILDDLGLEAALRWQLDRQAQRGGFGVQFVSELAGRRPSPEIETVCFRVAQEALTNISRHAHATHVVVELRRRADEMQLIIQDNGAGFDVKSIRRRADRGHSFGLSGMHERVELAGGKIAVNSEPGLGTRICASFANRSANSSGD